MKKIIALLLVLVVFFPAYSFAASYEGEEEHDALINYVKGYQLPDGSKEESETQVRNDLEDQIHYTRSGATVTIAGGKIAITLPEGYSYIDKGQGLFLYEMTQQKKATSDEQHDFQGILVHNGRFFDDESLVVYLEYSDDGYISDEDAASIDGDKMAKAFDEQSDKEERNKGEDQIKKTNHVWLIKPHYDSSVKTFEYATAFDEVEKGETLGSTMNSMVVMLGRTGHLTATVVGSKDQGPLIPERVADVKKMTSYTAGNTYADYNASTDKKSDYTIGEIAAGIVGIKLLAKVGFWALIAKGGKVILVAIVAVWVKFRNKISGWFGKKPKEPTEPTPPTEPTA